MRWTLWAGALGLAGGISPLADALAVSAATTTPRVAGRTTLESPLGRKGALIEVIDRELLVQLRPDLSGREKAAFLADYGLRIERDHLPGGWFKVRTPRPEVVRRHLRRRGMGRVLADRSGLKELLTSFRSDPRVRAAVPNSVCSSDLDYAGEAPPNDSYYAGYQWNLQMLNMEAAWQVEHGTAPREDVLIAVLDSGVAWISGVDATTGVEYAKHPDLADAFLHATDCVAPGSVAYDLNQHGTHVTGIIAAEIDNQTGVSGMAPFFTIAPVRVLDKHGKGTIEALVDGVRAVIEMPHPHRVMNLSVSFPPGFDPGAYLEDAIRDAEAAGIVLVAAAGNKNWPEVSYPAAYNEVIAVGAVDRDAARTSYSNYGHAIDVMAPGGAKEDLDQDGYPDAILSTSIAHLQPNHLGYWFCAGTSQASPHVAALAALLLSNASGVQVSLTPLEVQNIIEQTATDLSEPGWDVETGYGLIDPYRALTEWPSIVSLPRSELDGYVDPANPPANPYPSNQIGAVINDVELGVALFLETEEGFFCLVDSATDLVDTWQIIDYDLAGMCEGAGGIIGILEASGGLDSFLHSHAQELGEVETESGIIGILDASGGIIGMLDASGGLVSMLDASSDEFMAELMTSGGILGMLDASGDLLGMLDASGGMIATLDASGGILGMLDASGDLLGFLDASGATLDAKDLGASGSGGMDYFSGS
jgi:serine protease